MEFLSQWSSSVALSKWNKLTAKVLGRRDTRHLQAGRLFTPLVSCALMQLRPVANHASWYVRNVDSMKRAGVATEY